jgi:hypothetical protein
MSMKAIEFESQMNSDHSLSVPAIVAEGIPTERPIRVLLLIPETDDDQQWESRAAVDFGQGYADSDAIYDSLSAG